MANDVLHLKRDKNLWVCTVPIVLGRDEGEFRGESLQQVVDSASRALAVALERLQQPLPDVCRPISTLGPIPEAPRTGVAGAGIGSGTDSPFSAGVR